MIALLLVAFAFLIATFFVFFRGASTFTPDLFNTLTGAPAFLTITLAIFLGPVFLGPLFLAIGFVS